MKNKNDLIQISSTPKWLKISLSVVDSALLFLLLLNLFFYIGYNAWACFMVFSSSSPFLLFWTINHIILIVKKTKSSIVFYNFIFMAIYVIFCTVSLYYYSSFELFFVLTPPMITIFCICFIFEQIALWTGKSICQPKTISPTFNEKILVNTSIDSLDGYGEIKINEYKTSLGMDYEIFSKKNKPFKNETKTILRQLVGRKYDSNGKEFDVTAYGKEYFRKISNQKK